MACFFVCHGIIHILAISGVHIHVIGSLHEIWNPLISRRFRDQGEKSYISGMSKMEEKQAGNPILICMIYPPLPPWGIVSCFYYKTWFLFLVPNVPKKSVVFQKHVFLFWRSCVPGISWFLLCEEAGFVCSDFIRCIAEKYFLRMSWFIGHLLDCLCYNHNVIFWNLW